MKKFIKYFKTPIGIIKIIAGPNHLEQLEFVDLKEIVPTELVNTITQLTSQQLEEYFAGTREVFDLPIQLQGTDFTKQILNTISVIPYAATKSYKEIAEISGHNNAFRAVGSVNRKNSLPIIIPCHRVIAHDGSIGGYSSGIWRKQWLLNHEEKFSP